MESNLGLPFKAGQQGESKSFDEGFRGAWFRCKIHAIDVKNGKARHQLEYFDFPDEKRTWLHLYQKPPSSMASQPGKSSKQEMELMVRPRFPPVYHENEVPDITAISETVAVVDGTWKVGDLVDWKCEDCYWSGKITQILGNDEVKLELPDIPIGEGGSYDASYKDMRPSLDWSPEHGWTVPISKDGETCRYCARLVQPLIQGNNGNIAAEEASCKSNAASASSHCSLPLPEISSHSPVSETQDQTSASNLNNEMSQRPRRNTSGSVEKTTVSESSSTHGEEMSAATGKSTCRDPYNHSASKKMKTTSGGKESNSECSGTIESSIMDLEELVNKVKWLKGAMDFGFQFANQMKPSWKFLEDRATL